MDYRRVALGVTAVIVVAALAGCSGAVPLPTPDSESTAEPVGAAAGPSWNVTVTYVVDGDTVDVQYENGSTETVRLLGVDTPETPPNSISPGEFEGIPDSDAGRKHLTSWGEQATTFAERELAGENVQLVVDDRADRRGGYGRLLAHIYVDGENFNQRLLAEGYARLYESPFTYREEFAETEATAQRNGVGLWGFEDATATAAAVRPPATPLPTAYSSPIIERRA